MIKISVIIPVYNAEKYLRQCLDSVCNQTLKEIEIICVDDGSTDESAEILFQYQKEDSRIQIYKQANQFAGVARNNGMHHATGKYLLFLDADDYFNPEYLEKVYWYAEKNCLDVTICQYEKYIDDLKMITKEDFSNQESLLPEKDVFCGSELRDAAIFQLTQGWAWDKLFLREFVNDCGYEFSDMRSSEDGYFTFMLLARAKRMGYLKETLLTYRIGNQQSLSATKDANWENGFLMLREIYDELHRAGLYETYQKSFLLFVIQFELWYVPSMNSYQSFRLCFERMKQEEKTYRILEYKEWDCFNKTWLERYDQMIELPVDEYIFEKMKAAQIAQDKEYYYRLHHKKGWLFPFEKLPKNKRILLYGAGAVGQAYYEQLIKSGYTKELVWADKAFEKYQKEGLSVSDPNTVKCDEIDYIFVAILKQDIVRAVKNEFVEKGFAEDRIVF